MDKKFATGFSWKGPQFGPFRKIVFSTEVFSSPSAFFLFGGFSAIQLQLLALPLDDAFSGKLDSGWRTA